MVVHGKLAVRLGLFLRIHFVVEMSAIELLVSSTTVRFLGSYLFHRTHRRRAVYVVLRMIIFQDFACAQV